MHIVFIVGSYYPNYSAVGKCAGNVADELSKGHKVTVVCQKNAYVQTDEETYNNQKIIRVITKDKIKRERLNKKISTYNGIKRKLHKFLLNIYKLSRGFKIVLSKFSIQKDTIDKYVDALKSIKEPIDAIICASMPFESVLAGVEYKDTYNSEVKIIPYLFDQFVDSDTLHRIGINKKFKRKRHINLERKSFQRADFILSMHSLNAHFQRDLPEIKNIKYMEHPLILNSRISAGTNNTEIKLAYIGGLYKNYVMPDYLLKLFKESNIREAVLHFYIIGNCSEIVDNYCANMPKRIVNHGSVNKQTANNEIANSNILISIAEAKGIQMSSKIFEYMSFGKPIIHFYSAENDVNLKILNKYPLALCLRQDNEFINKNVSKFDEFCRKNHDSSIVFEQVESLFMDASPRYTANLIEQIVLKNS